MTELTIVVPAYNDEAHLPHALARLLEQRHVDFEIVVIDDGSPDGSAAIAEAAALIDPRIRLLRQPRNLGVAAARQRGVADAAGKWIWFVDSDDDWADDAAAAMVAEARRTGADVVVAGARFEFASGKPGRSLSAPAPGTVETGEAALARLLSGDITGHLWNKLFRRTTLSAVEYVPAKVQSDLPMVAQALAAAGTVAYLDHEVYRYRVRAGSIITSRSRRSESLASIAAAVDRAVAMHPDLDRGSAHRYFRGRYIVLSGMKDAVLGGYTDAERPALIAAARGRIGPSVLRTFLERRDWRRLALALTARTSLPAYRRLLDVADR